MSESNTGTIAIPLVHEEGARRLDAQGLHANGRSLTRCSASVQEPKQGREPATDQLLVRKAEAQNSSGLHSSQSLQLSSAFAAAALSPC
ncbi:hypothetical protein, partial [Mesorhizobium sp. M7A.T.Ca.TU.009.02.1.1]|uniref:hypothetical protein n=1 Tax=Mesorhizobium sp. M7A.T.Ca.TU.009.02.1.1 TaxID=2496791 RepID=UPI0019D2D3EE